MTESAEDNTSEQMQLSNREAFDKWNIDPFVDPMSLELETLDPAHPALFEANTFWPYFERLRAESPVHYTPESMVGPYWSVTKFTDIMHVDTHHEEFSSDINPVSYTHLTLPTIYSV